MAGKVRGEPMKSILAVAVEIPVIEVMLGAGGAESGANDNQS